LISVKFEESDELFEAYFKLHEKDHDIERKKKRKITLEQIIRNYSTKKSIGIIEISDILKDFSKIIPIFFVTDEIQEFQKFEMHTSETIHETGLHYYAQFLSDLLQSPIFIMLSGTRYHILSQIGEKIGSPLRSKVQSMILSKFTEEDIGVYIQKIQEIFHTTFKGINIGELPKFVPIIEDIIQNYHQFLLGFSGGHPRTIAFITDILITNLIKIDQWDQYLDYSRFMTFLLEDVENILTTGILPSDIKQALIDLNSNAVFGIVKAWMINGAYIEGQFLGTAPKYPESPTQTEEIEFLIYNLMNMGMIVKNGNANYYLTSYFHFRAFISVYSQPHEEFLRSVLYNKTFQLLCGSHSGFGYVFEHILAAVILNLPDASFSSKSIPLLPSQIRKLQTIKKQPKWTQFTFEPDLLYHFPTAKAIDFCILQNQTLLLLQLTTRFAPESDKIRNMFKLGNDLSRIKNDSGNPINIHYWFISLHPIEYKDPISTNFTLTMGDQLIPLIGKELYDRLKSVKTQF
jgi:hypothetical protein